MEGRNILGLINCQIRKKREGRNGGNKRRKIFVIQMSLRVGGRKKWRGTKPNKVTG